MSRKSALSGLFLAIGISLLTACSSVGAASPQTSQQPAGHSAHPMCVTPQIPACHG